MVKKATLYKVQIKVEDINQHRHINQTIRLAQHPSESVERMMLRLIAWAMYANDKLQFTKGLCVKSQPELWIKNANEDIKLWIELGLASEKRLKKACNLAQKVVLFVYNDKAAVQWKKQKLSKLDALCNLTVIHIVDEVLTSAALACSRDMDVKVLLENGQMRFSIGKSIIAIEPQTWKIENF